MKLTLVKSSAGDWAGLYIDGKLDYQNHSIDAGEVLSALDRQDLPDFKVEYYEISTEDMFPEDLTDLIF